MLVYSLILLIKVKILLSQNIGIFKACVLFNFIKNALQL